MTFSRPTILFLALTIGATVSFAAQPRTNTYSETRQLLLQMERAHANKALKKLFEEGVARRSDLIEALYDPDQKISLNAQSIIRYLADPQDLSALEKWYEYRRVNTKEYWTSPVTLLAEVRFLEGRDRDLTKLVLNNLHRNEKDFWAKLVAYNKTTNTALLEVVEGEVFTAGWHVTIRREHGKWRLLSNYLVWES
ncbi:MAG: hypothetical protein ND895_18205 [Pyrinomonadaceae bacterium]|nr:hypothetical protein [Pyrinomonadaceae bacterium]